MIHKIKRFFQIIGISFYKTIILQTRQGERDIDFSSGGAKIFRNLVKRSDSTLLISPLAGKRYIKSEKLDLFITLLDKKMSIVNHQFKYDLDLSHSTTYKLENMFDLQVEKRRHEMEQEMTSNVKSSLCHIYEEIIKK